MAAPTPSRFQAEWQEFVASVRPHDPAKCGRVLRAGERPWQCLACDYRDLYRQGLTETVGDSVKTRAPASSPTEAVAMGKAASRDACARVFRQLKAAIVAIESIEPTIAAAEKRADGAHAATEKYPPGSSMITDEERDATLAAAERRRVSAHAVRTWRP